MALTAGQRLGVYEVMAPLGAGGMGEVYRARDTRLGREVAIKVLPADRMSDESRRKRFVQEARAASALNHPNIVTIYEIESAGGADFIVMELVSGKTLGELIRPGMRLKEALRLAIPVADALARAHAAGIVHRDLKPANVMVGDDGSVKVLDFGLVKLVGDTTPSDSDADRVTATAEDLTRPGTVAGTPGYMSPEQATGDKVDARSDIFSFGAVLYEMVTARRAFAGSSTADTLAKVVNEEPVAPGRLAREVPEELERLILRCLRKEPERRLQSIADAKVQLEEIAGQLSSRPGLQPVARPRRWIKPAAGAALGVALVGVGLALYRRGPTSPRKPAPVRLQIGLPPNTSLVPLATVAVSPDGTRIASTLASKGEPPRIFVRPLDVLAAAEVKGTEGGVQPFWSPDGRQLGLWRNGLARVDLTGGALRSICKSCQPDHGAAWGSADVIVFSEGGKLFSVPAQGGDPQPQASLVPAELGRFWPHFLPDGRHYIYLSLSSRPEDQGIYAGALDSDLRKRIVPSEFGAAHSRLGYLLYLREGTLVAQRFDAARLEVSGAPVPILDDEIGRIAGSVNGGVAMFSVSSNGVLAWRTKNIFEAQQLTWFDRAGRKAGTVGEPGFYFIGSEALSRDGATVLVSRVESPGKRDLWLLDVASGAARRVTFDPKDDAPGIWSHDDKWIVFGSDRRGGPREIYRKAIDGSASEEILLASTDHPRNPESWSSDGRFMSFTVTSPRQSQDIYLLPLTRKGAPPVPFLATPAFESWGALAPNGRFLAYMSNEAGFPQVFVREVSPDGSPGSGRWQISPEVGFAPKWRPDGKELFFLGRTTMMAVDVDIQGPAFKPGIPKALGITSDEKTWGMTHYAVGRNGERFLFQVPVRELEPIRVLVNALPTGS
jgi:tRNA A-37 threonylcarbamoyl transferase component Bud32